MTRSSDSVWIEVDGLVEPQPIGEERRWFESAAEGRLLVTRCGGCGMATFPLRAVCPTCGSPDTSDEAVTGSATVHSYTIQHRSQHPGVPVPNVVALVELDEGPRMLSRIVEADPADVRIGMRVTVRFSRCGEYGVPVFVPEEGGEGA